MTDPPFAAISIETSASAPVKILSANHIEVGQAKMPDTMRIARQLSVCALYDYMISKSVGVSELPEGAFAGRVEINVSKRPSASNFSKAVN